MNKKPITATFTWGEAANLLVAAQQTDTRGWTKAARGNLQRACEKLAAEIPMNNPNDLFLVVRGQTVIKVIPDTIEGSDWRDPGKLSRR